jgi:hypothetical protein
MNMKKKLLFIVSVVMLFLAGCKETAKPGKPETVSFNRSSSDKKAQLRIEGNRPAPDSGWNIGIYARMGILPETGIKRTVNCKTLDSTNVQMNWSDNRHCLVVFLEQDGRERSFNVVYVDSIQVYVNEVQ